MRWSLCCWLDFLPLAAGPELDRVLVLDTELAATRGVTQQFVQHSSIYCTHIVMLAGRLCLHCIKCKWSPDGCWWTQVCINPSCGGTEALSAEAWLQCPHHTAAAPPHGCVMGGLCGYLDIQMCRYLVRTILCVDIQMCRYLDIEI